ncbi:hypothetical protein DB346_08985 [Verrucomicrobia bacterium LW23]|nr:hypothetical protein DB346_08985 [Verrucomicrobia bacterium LW23]
MCDAAPSAFAAPPAADLAPARAGHRRAFPGWLAVSPFRSVALAICITGALALSALAEEEPAVIKSTLPQPAAVPALSAKDPKLAELPPLTEILATARHQPYLYGLYTWKGEYKKHRESIRKVGWNFFRIGGPLDDEIARLLSEDKAVAMVVTQIRKITRTEGVDPAAQDAELIKGATEKITAFWTRYGTKGTFWAENPHLTHRPYQVQQSNNEPNFQYMIAPDKRPNAEIEADRYRLMATLQPECYKAFKAIEPDLPFMGFTAGGASAGDIRYVKAVHELNPETTRYYDGLCTHPYVAPTPPEGYADRSWGRYSIASGLAELRRIMAAHGRTNVPVWYSEGGWEISHKDGGKYNLDDKKAVSPDMAAACYARYYAYSLRLGVERVTPMFITDTDNYNGGFFLPDGTWRPAAKAVQTMIRLIPSPRLIAALADGDNGVFAYAFAPGDAAGKPAPAAPPVVMLWNALGTRIVTLPVAAPAGTKLRVTDMLGATQEVAAKDGVLRLEAGPYPLYITADAPTWLAKDARMGL